MELNFLPESKYLSCSGLGGPGRIGQEPPTRSAKPFKTLEIEISTRCDLFCPSCPRATYCNSWIDQDMSLEHFRRISAAFPYFENIHFRGWGEPLMNADFGEMVRMAHQSGAHLILTTNGVRQIPPELLPFFEAVIFRLDYGRASTYERRNPKAKFNRVILNISEVRYWRERNCQPKPLTVVTFAKNRYSLPELPCYLETAIKLKPDRVVFYQPSFHVRKVDEKGDLPGSIDMGLVRKIDCVLEKRAESSGVDMINQPLDSDPAGRCVFDPVRTMFVNWSGRVGMCRDSALPVASGRFTRYYHSGEELLETALFGCLGEDPLEEICRSRDFRDFRRACIIGGGCRGFSTDEPRIQPDQVPENLIFMGGERLRSCRCYRR